jgi:hypothetical protein
MQNGVLCLLVVLGCAHSEPAPRPSAPVTEDLPPQEERREGAITPEEYQAVDDVMKRKMEVLHYCYEQEMEKRMDRSFKGTVTIGMKLGRDGRATSVTVLEDTLAAPAVNQCLIDTIKKFEFGSLTGEADFVYPIQFAPQY